MSNNSFPVGLPTRNAYRDCLACLSFVLQPDSLKKDHFGDTFPNVDYFYRGRQVFDLLSHQYLSLVYFPYSSDSMDTKTPDFSVLLESVFQVYAAPMVTRVKGWPNQKERVAKGITPFHVGIARGWAETVVMVEKQVVFPA